MGQGLRLSSLSSLEAVEMGLREVKELAQTTQLVWGDRAEFQTLGDLTQSF